MDPQIKQETRAEWRELGFFYDRDDGAKEWHLVGSRTGLGRFAQLLRAYAGHPGHAMKSEHEHYGPYMYLEIMTWPEAGMNDHSIHGPLDALERFASLVEVKIASLRPGEKAWLREEFAPEADYTLVLNMRPDDFDPASADGGVT